MYQQYLINYSIKLYQLLTNAGEHSLYGTGILLCYLFLDCLFSVSGIEAGASLPSVSASPEAADLTSTGATDSVDVIIGEEEYTLPIVDAPPAEHDYSTAA